MKGFVWDGDNELCMNYRLGEKHWKARITNEDAILIASLLKEGLSQSEIARKFDIGRNIVHNIACGRSWGHVIKRKVK